MYYNKIVGGMRMRQVKVQPNVGCIIAINVQTSFTASKGPDAGTERARTPLFGPRPGAEWHHGLLDKIFLFLLVLIRLAIDHPNCLCISFCDVFALTIDGLIHTTVIVLLAQAPLHIGLHFWSYGNHIMTIRCFASL